MSWLTCFRTAKYPIPPSAATAACSAAFLYRLSFTASVAPTSPPNVTMPRPINNPDNVNLANIDNVPFHAVLLALNDRFIEFIVSTMLTRNTSHDIQTITEVAPGSLRQR